jgi:hypothetical protein
MRLLNGWIVRDVIAKRQQFINLVVYSCPLCQVGTLKLRRGHQGMGQRQMIPDGRRAIEDNCGLFLVCTQRKKTALLGFGRRDVAERSGVHGLIARMCAA